MRKGILWLIDGARAARTVALVVAAIAGAILDGQFVDGRVGELPGQLASSFKSWGADKTFPPPPSQ